MLFRVKQVRNLFLFILPLIAIAGTNAQAEQIAPTFSQKLDIQVRYDNRSNRPSREQYRLRYYPSLAITSAWSVNSFVVTGDDFSSSHNTFGSDNTDYLYARRLYLRHETGSGKTELGVIPTYKGRVSSTGLSKDGWITGVRHVKQLQNDTAIEIVVGQGAKPGGGGMLLGQKISDRVAEMRNLPKGIDQRSACRHPDWTGPDDLEIKILELREITGWKVPIYVKVAGARPYYDTTLAIKAGADAIVLDGMQGGTAATQDVFIEHVGQPTLAIVRPAVQALQDLGMHRKVQLILSGGIRNGADVAKAMALGADAVAIGSAALIALGDNDPVHEAEYNKLGTTAGAYDDWHEGMDPAGITTQDPDLMKRFDPKEGGRKLRNYLKVMTLEAQTIARACGKNHLHNLEPEDLVALTMEAAAMAQVPLAGTNWYPGKPGTSY